MKERVVQALKDAVAAMNDKGAHWVQGTLRDTNEWPDNVYDDGYRYCSLGALYFVTGADLDQILASSETDKDAIDSGDLELRRAAVLAVAAQIPDSQMPDGWGTVYVATEGEPEEVTEFHKAQWRITTWNDNGNRTWDDVVALFAKAQQQVEGAPSTT